MENKKILLGNILLLVALSLFILIPIIASVLLGINVERDGNTSLIISGVASVLALGGISLLYCKITKRSFKNVMVIKKISIKQVIAILFATVGTYIFAVGINIISMRLFKVVAEDSKVITDLLSNSSTLIGLVVVVLIPAFFEEIFFRGVLLDAYEGMNRKLKYFIITAIFASFHGNVMQIIYVMFLGLILLKIREYTGSILGSMLLHGVNNAISFSLSKVAMAYMKLMEKEGLDVVQEGAKADAMNRAPTATLFGAFVFFLVGGTILFISLRRLKGIKEEKEGLELVKEDYMEIGETYVEIKEEVFDTDKKQYIPLAIYFVVITLLVVSSY
ncbi:type II CAAX endopeptidase family protein [Clostridium sp.]|uniref:CPBP family intramembrane glutamic endopeptidase n=1 Tax=Clostridium sp. TaxID=1506 RepID=UPI001A38BADC|nr:type II CAAX endopeptidase family protein [Clostridium sp.]MBK5241958.1 CPBP family intramembrane metalloprotease [Clostridium sp.]